MPPLSIGALDDVVTVLATHDMLPLLCQPLWDPKPGWLLVSPSLLFAAAGEFAIVQVKEMKVPHDSAPLQLSASGVLDPPQTGLVVLDDCSGSGH